MKESIAQAAKAFLAASLAGLGALGSIVVGDVSLGDVSAAQWIFIAFTAETALAGVYHISNKPPPA